MFTKGDYHKTSIGIEQKEYKIGTNSGKHFVANETTILCDVDCEIKINDDTFWQPIYADEYFVSGRKIVRISFKSADSGNIEIWAEGKY